MSPAIPLLTDLKDRLAPSSLEPEDRTSRPNLRALRLELETIGNLGDPLAEDHTLDDLGQLKP